MIYNTLIEQLEFAVYFAAIYKYALIKQSF